MRLHRLLQEMRREYPGTGGHHAGFMDCRSVSALRRDQTLSPFRNLSPQTVIQAQLQKGAIGCDVMGEMKRAIARER